MDSSFPMSQPSASQPQNAIKIFVAADDSPLPIFVDSNGITDNRPWLIRTLRTHGAKICPDVSLARIILVEPNSSSGRQFVREWGMDPGKVILDVTWHRRCLEAGRALLENDAFAGCGDLDGSPLEGDAADEEEQGLFSESKASALNGKATRQPTKLSAAPRTSRPSNMNNDRSSALTQPRPTPNDYGPTNADALAAGHDNLSASQRLPTPPSTSMSTQFEPSSANIHHMQPGMPQNMAPPFGQLVPQSQFPPGHMNPQAMQALIMSNPEMAVMAYNMVMGMVSGGQMAPQGWQGQQSPPPTFMQPQPGFQMMQPPQSQPVSSMLPPDTNGHHGSASTTRHDEDTAMKADNRSPPRPFSPLPDITTFEDSDSDSPPPNLSILSQRGKKRFRDSHSNRSSNSGKRSRSRSPPSLTDKKRKKRSSVIYDVTEQRDPIKSDRPPPVGIFTSDNGEQMTFFVQIQLRNRAEMARKIRLNGGKLVPELRDAEFIILDTRPGKDRDQWMKSVVDLKRYALRPGFVEACINSGGLVEEDDFYVEPVNKSGKSHPSRKKKREDSVETEDRNSPSPSPISHNHDRRQSSTDGLRTPSPPLAPTMMLSGGRYAFTAEEIAYAPKFAEHLIRKNPDITNYQIATQLAKKTSTHPQASWFSKLQGQLRSQIERIREKVPKTVTSPNVTLNGSEREENQVEEQLMQDANSAPRLNGNNAKQREGQKAEQVEDGRRPEQLSEEERSRLHNVDLKTIVDFFASPPNGMDDDDALWAAITDSYTCHTAPTWQDFYESNQEVVNQRLREALTMPSERAASNATS
ncbi:uncharacterized protein FOMMEDRAFT_140150 [Fomitiporia mediterranea MF3/22]|uniref:uncharacterized protein n=1 Tax=Fomitiporia mediterranea (strain MF3/22) TaxID=694068 RepID=UPI0004409588|nr:uncharacterized protein FOMMEDRAFT_140150 [Fomitiporia mediterranea MF3/22]EJD04079.1 hypothetical protein FOMMEDRAFT_140150 [Fomitiporia mediterranea MF3/22]